MRLRKTLFEQLLLDVFSLVDTFNCGVVFVFLFQTLCFMDICLVELGIISIEPGNFIVNKGSHCLDPEHMASNKIQCLVDVFLALHRNIESTNKAVFDSPEIQRLHDLF